MSFPGHTMDLRKKREQQKNNFLEKMIFQYRTLAGTSRINEAIKLRLCSEFGLGQVICGHKGGSQIFTRLRAISGI